VAHAAEVAVTIGDLLDRHPVALDFLRAIGVRYYYSRGTPATPWADMRPKGVDCSGFVQMALVRAGLYRNTEPDRRATTSMPGRLSLADICIETKVPRFGDLAIYPNHVMLVLDEMLVIGASGGTSTTFGDDARACVGLHRFDYRRDFLCFGTLKPPHRRSDFSDDLTPT
jgi:hypothetical protein